MIGGNSATNRFFFFCLFFRISRTNPSKNTFLAFVRLSKFFGLEPGWGKEGTALQYKAGSGGGGE